MRMRWCVLVLLFVLIGATVPTYAVGTVTVTRSRVFGTDVINQYSVAWTSSAGGAVSGNAFSVVPGDIVRVEFVPASGGTQPSDLYDATLVITSGADALGGQGANLSNSI